MSYQSQCLAYLTWKHFVEGFRTGRTYNDPHHLPYQTNSVYQLATVSASKFSLNCTCFDGSVVLGSHFPRYWRGDHPTLYEHNRYTSLSWAPYTPSNLYLSSLAVCHTAAICSHSPKIAYDTWIGNLFLPRRLVNRGQISQHFSSLPSLYSLGAVS